MTYTIILILVLVNSCGAAHVETVYLATGINYDLLIRAYPVWTSYMGDGHKFFTITTRRISNSNTIAVITGTRLQF